MNITVYIYVYTLHLCIYIEALRACEGALELGELFFKVCTYCIIYVYTHAHPGLARIVRVCINV